MYGIPSWHHERITRKARWQPTHPLPLPAAPEAPGPCQRPVTQKQRNARMGSCSRCRAHNVAGDTHHIVELAQVKLAAKCGLSLGTQLRNLHLTDLVASRLARPGRRGCCSQQPCIRLAVARKLVPGDVAVDLIAHSALSHHGVLHAVPATPPARSASPSTGAPGQPSVQAQRT